MVEKTNTKITNMRGGYVLNFINWALSDVHFLLFSLYFCNFCSVFLGWWV